MNIEDKLLLVPVFLAAVACILNLSEDKTMKLFDLSFILWIIICVILVIKE